jgi:vacuolar-type H+-ATPase subunit D/Vma8
MIVTERTRADRLRLLDRIALARRAGELLRSKEEALERESERLEGHLTRARAEWERLARDAAGHLVRARVLGGGGEVAALGEVAPTATVTPHWQASMGIVYPGEVTCVPGPMPALTSTAALRPAAAAYREALVAAATVAAADEAGRRLDAELAQTRRRRRAVEERLLPDLLDRRHRLDLRLDELDREEAQRVRAASAQLAGRRG